MSLPRDPHVDVGAYALGVLAPAERAAFERHLAGCALCRARARRLGALGPLLADFTAGAAVAGGEPLARPSPQLLERLVGKVSVGRRRRRVRQRVLAGVATVLAVGGPVATGLVVSTELSVQQAAAQTFTASDPTTDVAASVGVTPESWGSRIDLGLSRVNGPLACDLVAVNSTGARQIVATWTVPMDGYANTLHTTGSSGFPPAAIDHFEVRTLDGHQLLVAVPTSSARAG